jgi:hypothetical protein
VARRPNTQLIRKSACWGNGCGDRWRVGRRAVTTETKLFAQHVRRKVGSLKLFNKLFVGDYFRGIERPGQPQATHGAIRGTCKIIVMWELCAQIARLDVPAEGLFLLIPVTHSIASCLKIAFHPVCMLVFSTYSNIRTLPLKSKTRPETRKGN